MKLLNHQTTKLSNHQTIFSHKGHKERKEGGMEVGMNVPTIQQSNDSTIQRSNDSTIQRSNAAEECTMHNAPCTISGMKTSRAPRGRLGHVARWAAVAAVAAGAWLGFAREAKANQWDENFWKSQASSTNWNSTSWWNETQRWDDHNPNYEGYRRLVFDNNNKSGGMGNNFDGAGTNMYQIIFTNGATQTRTIRGANGVWYAFHGKDSSNHAKIENNLSQEVEHQIWFNVCATRDNAPLELNPVTGNLSLTNLAAGGQIINVYGTKSLSIMHWFAGTNDAQGASSTLYVDSTAKVYIERWRAAASKKQYINAKVSGSRVAISNLYSRGNAYWYKQGEGEMVLGGGAQYSGQVGALDVTAGTLVFSNFTGTATTRIIATNLTLTNRTTVVMKCPVQMRRYVLETGSTVEMDVFNNSSAAKLGVIETLASKPDNESGVVSYGGRTTTLKLRLTSGFDPTQNGSFIVYEGRADANSMSGESAGITLQTVDLVGGRTLGTFALREGKNSASGAGAKTAIWVDYTKPAVAPTVETPTATSISGSGATLGATVTDNGGAALTGGGVVYSSSATTPTVGGSGCTSASYGTPTVNTPFTKAVSSLTAGTLYYYRGYAVNSAGTGYSTVGQFRTTASAPSAPTGLTVTQPATSTSGLTVSWTAASGSAGTVVVMYTSDPTTAPTARTTYTGNAAYGSAPSALGGKVVYMGSGTSVSVTGLSAGTRYYVRAYAYKGTASDTPALNSLAYSGAASANGYTLASQPTGAPTSLSVTARDQDSMTVSWTKGANSTYTLVIARQTSAPSGNPVDGSEYTADAEYGEGDELMSGYVVYAGNGTSVEVTGLTAGTRYYFWAYSFNGTGVSVNYYTTSKAAVNNYTLVNTPSPATGLSVTDRGTTTLTMEWTRGSGTTYTLVAMRPGADLSAGPTDGTAPSDGGDSGRWTYGEGDALGGGRVVHNHNNTSGTATGLTPATHYYIAAHSRAGSGTGNTYAYGTAVKDDAWTLSTAPGSVGTISGSALGSRKAKLTWTKAGSESGVLVVVVTSGTPAPVPGTMYTGTGVYGGSGGGSALGNGYVVYRGTSAQTDYTVTGLEPSTSYTAYLFPYNVGSDDSTVNYGPAASPAATFSTGAATGPAVTAAGVDANGMTMAWDSVSGASAYDVEASGIGTKNVPFSTDFTGWTSGKRTATQSSSGGTWTLNNVNVEPGNKRIYFYYTDGTDAWIELPPLNGVVTNITATLLPASVGERGIWLEFYEGGEWVKKAYFTMTWTELNQVKFVYAQPFIAKNQRVRLRNASNAWTMYVYGISAQGDNPGEGLKGRTVPVLGLSSGNSVTLSASAAGTGDYGSATVMAGVVPGEVEAEKTWNSLTFSWDAPSVGTCVGYEVEVASADAGWASDVVCEGSALSSSSYSSSGWKYNGVTASGSAGTVRSAPTYNNGHCLVGKSGIGMESRGYDIAGATELELKYRVCAWNLSGASGATADAKTDVGRIEAYYKIDSGDWHFLGSARPSFTNDNYYTDVTNRLTEGMLNGRTVAFKLIAPNAAGDGGTYLRGAYIQALRIHKVSALAGDYTTPVDTDTLAAGTETYTLSGLNANTKRHFRVRALQGADLSHITARRVWVEATETTAGLPGPTLLAANPIGRYGFTANWSASAEATGGYQIQWTRCGGSGATDTVVTNCANGTLTAGGDEGWRYLRPDYSSYPKWTNGPANKTWGYNMMVGVASPSQKPAIASPDMDLSSYSGGYVEFSHWSRHNGYYDPDATVTLWYRTKPDGGAWGEWVRGTDTPALANATTIVTEQLPIPPEAVGSGKTHVQIKLSTEYSLTGGGSGNPDGGVYTGPYIKDIAVHGTSSGTPDYSDSCALGHSAIIDVPSGTSKALSGLAAGTPYYYQVRFVVTGSPTTYSEWTQGRVTTLSPQTPPAEVWAEDAKQTHLTVAWDEADGATESTLYKVQITACPGTPWESLAVPASSTNADLGDEDDWLYVGGGTDVTTAQKSYITGRGMYPAYAGGVERSQVLAGEGAPGLESAMFSTVGATNAVLRFGSGRWYDENSTYADASKLTLMYSIDGGETWVAWTTNATVRTVQYAYNNVHDYELPAAALGHSQVKVRIVAESAGLRGSDNEPMGAAISLAKVTLHGASGDYTGSGCLKGQAEDLSYEQLSQVFGSLSPDTTYYFRVAASDGTQYGNWVTGSGRTLAVPATPTEAPWAEDVGTHGFTMLWKAVDGADAYNVKVYTSGNESSPTFAQDGVQGTSIEVTGLAVNTTYYMKVQPVGDGQPSAGWSPAGTQKTLDGVHVTGVHAENESLTSLDVVWDTSSGMTYSLEWGDADTTGTDVAEVLSCPNTTLGRSDWSNEWYYVGGNNSQPSYWVGSAANDKGHALIYKAGTVAPGLQSRWFSTRGAGEVEVSFLHGRFNNKANSAVTLSYSTDMGKTWTVAGTTAQTDGAVPTNPVTMTLPAAALGQKSVAVRLSAEEADGNKGAHVNNVKVRILCGKGTVRGTVADAGASGRYTLSGPNVTSGKRYWFKITGTETATGTTADMTASGATHEAPATYWKSLGFDGYDGSQALSYTTNFLKLSDGTTATTDLPTVQVVDGENPMYGHKALRFGGSAAASVFGVAEFDVGSIGGKSGVLTIPFAAKDLGKNDYLYFCYSTDNGSTWHAPVTNVTTMGGAKMARIGIGGSDKPNQNWPYNRGTNTTTRPLGNAFVWTFPPDVVSASTLKFRIAFCGQSGSAEHYYYVDNISLLANAGTPTAVSATAEPDGSVKLEWTPPSGQDVIIVCGKDQREAPPSPLELASLGSEYRVVMNGDSAVWPNGGAHEAIDWQVAGGDRYYYYFYGVLNGQIGLTPAVAWVIPDGMVLAIASQGFDGWDVHPWEYEMGRVTHPIWYADYGWWVNVGHYSKTGEVAFVTNSFDVNAEYRNYYEGTSSDQVAVSPYTNYFGTYSLRLSGGGASQYRQTGIVWTNQQSHVVTNSNPWMGTNNAAVLFENVDLSGYRNVKFSMHYAGALMGGGNYLYLAISTNGGSEWLGFSNENGGWNELKGKYAKLGYGLQLQGMQSEHTGEKIDFYSQELADYGNPFVLKVPDSVTQFMARVMFYDSNGSSTGWRNAAFFIDEIRLTGELAMETPRPVITEVGKTTATVEWGAIPDATSYNVRLTKTEKTPLVVKMNEAFVVSNFVNGWTASGNPKFTAGSDYGGSGYGLVLDGTGYGVVSPEAGAASSMTFWVKKTSGLTRKLVVYSKDTTDGTDNGEWVKLKEFAAGDLSTTYQQKTVPLPSRQYQKVKICAETGTGNAGNIYLDQIVILGGGDYTTTTSTYTTSDTSKALTGLTEGARFWVSVQAYGKPAGVDSYSKWGETAEYTQGTVNLAPDGFEMVRMWGTASSSAQVLVVSSAGDDPIGTPEGGVTYSAGNTLPGGGTVVGRWTSSPTQNSPFEHVVPAGAQVNYAVFWKRGEYYEGRYETNFWMGQYGCDAADAFSQTNGTDVGAAGWSANGKGWGANWTVASSNITWTCAEAARNSAQPFGLLKNTQLYGAGGNMLALYPGDATDTSKRRTVLVTRDLGTTFGKDDMWWGMFTMKSTWNGSSKWAGIQLLDASGKVLASIGKLWGGNDALGVEGKKNNNTVTGTGLDGWGGGGGYTIVEGSTNMIFFLWDNANGKMLVSAKKVTSATDPVVTGSTGAPGTGSGEIAGWKAEAVIDLGTVAKVRFVAESDVGQAINNVYFDEFRIGPTWESLIKEPAPPNPVTSAHAIPDGKELVRLDWTYGSSDSDHPAATGVLVLDKATAWTAAEIESIKPVNGQRYSAGQSIGAATVAYLGPAGWTNGTTLYQDAVVEPGTVHYYRFFAHSGYIYTNGVAASSTAPSGYPVTMGTYLDNEYVDTFSYTNATTAGTNWNGGKGFENGELGNHYWGDVTGTWTAMLPASQPGHGTMPTFGEIEGYPASAGNLVKLSNPGNNAGASMRRDLPRLITASDTNFYVAFRMAYQYEGANKWAGLSLLDASGTEKGFVGKGSGSYWYTLCVEGGGNKSWGTDLRGFDGDSSKTYLVIMRYNFSSKSLSAITVQQGGQVPDYEPTVWDASIGVDITGIKKLMFQAGGLGDGVTIGDVWFDELRWGTQWQDILSGVCPDSIAGAWWQKADGTDLTQTYLGNSETFLIRSTPTGFGQEAWLTIDWTGGASAHTVTTNQLAWLQNEPGTPTYTWWSNKVQVVETGRVGGVVASADWQATAKVTAMNADCVAVSETVRVTVKPLVAPTKVLAVRDPVKTNSVINVSWKPWKASITGVDTNRKDVLVVRYTGTSAEDAEAKAAVAANQPMQGRAYTAGDSIGEGTVVWRGGDAGAVTNTPAKGLMPNTWYAFAVYTENYSYYSTGVVVSTNTAEGGHTIEIDGDPTDWYGEAPDTLDTAWVSLGEFIWKDKTGEERHSAGSGDTTVGNPSEDIDEFRVYADRDWVYFLVKMTNITDSTLPYVAVGMDDRRTGSSAKMNWLGDQSATEIGSNYWWTSENAHYPRWQLNVHQVTGQGTQVEMYTTDSTEWYAPQGRVDSQIWSAAVREGVGQAVEFRVPRSDIGLSGMAAGATKVQRFTVASFKNTGAWNNQNAGTAEIYGGTSKAVDSLAIAPQRPKSKPDNDYLLSSWDEDISDGKLDFWVDVTFSDSGIVENARPTPPAELVYPAQEARLKSSPTFQWKRGGDEDGRVTGYMLEVSTDEDFDDLNGTVALRVNVAAADDPADTASTVYSYDWSGAHQQTMYYWRVRSRDTGGRLSVATNGVFWVDEDGDGPVAVLKYVGTDVDGYMRGDYAQLEKLYPESLHTVTDSEIERVAANPSLKFGFVIEWTDPNGVYATNQIRSGASGTRVDDYKEFHNSYTAGDWAWNITSGDGRVSPNWDLVEFHKDKTDRSTKPSFIPTGGSADGWTTNFWDEMGCWGYQWGYDDAFMVGTTGTKQDQTRGRNGDSVITNLVRSAFDLHSFDTNVDYYLTVSAEDCTTWKESGSGWWDDGSWKSFKPGNDSGAPGKDYSSGWCLDGPNRARNVTTNQLLEIRVCDNDVTAPGASVALWGGNSLVVTTNSASGAPGATPEKQLAREASEGLPVWTATDGDLVGQPLAFHFNVYDSSMTGIRTGTVATASVTKGSRTTTMTNSYFMASLEQKVDGSTQTVTWTNWDKYDSTRSSLTASGTGMGEGTGPETVLTWYWPAVSGMANIETFWPRAAHDADNHPMTVSTNAIALSLWDLDNNRDGDQMGQETTLGYLKISDDDTDDPVLTSANATGTGIGAEAGALGSWPLSKNSDTAGTSELGATVGNVSGVAGTSVSGASSVGLSGTANNGGAAPNNGDAWAALGKYKGFQMTVTAPAGLSYTLASVSFEAHFQGSYPWRGPQNWGLFSSANSYATPIAGGTFDLTGEENEDATVSYAVTNWTGYAAGSTADPASGAVTYRLMMWRTDAPDSNQYAPSIYCKNLTLVGVQTKAEYKTVVTDGDLVAGTVTYTLQTHDAGSGVLASGKAYPEDVAEKADGRPEITFKHNVSGGHTPVDAKKLAISSPTPSSGKVAKGASDVAVSGRVETGASKKLIDVNDAGGKSSPYHYQLTATVWDADTDRPGDTRTATTVQANIPVYDDDYNAPVRGSGMQGGALGVLEGDLSTFAPSVGSGTNREYRINDRQLQQMINNSTKLYVGASFYDFSGWNRPTLGVTETNTSTAADILTLASGDGTVPAFSTNTTVNSSSATAYWTLDTSAAMEKLVANIAAGKHGATYAIQAASIADLDDDRQNDSGANIDSMSAADMNLGLVTFLDNDTGQPNVQGSYGGSSGALQWHRTYVGTGAGPQAGSWKDALVNTELLDDTSSAFATASAVNRVYDSELAAASDASPFQIRVPTFDLSGNQRGQSAQGVQAGTTETTSSGGVTRTNSYLQIGTLQAKNRVNWSSTLSSPVADTKMAARFPTNVWAWTSFTPAQVGTWLPAKQTLVEYALKIGIYDADSDRNGDQMFREVSLGTLQVRDDDTTNPNPPSEAKVNGVSVPTTVGTLDRTTAAWTNDLTGWNLTFAPANDDATRPADDLAASGVDQANGYRMVEKEDGASCAGAAWLDLENVVELTTTEDEGTRRRVGLTTAQRAAVPQGLTTQMVFAVDMDADRPGDALASTGMDVPLAYDITPPTVIGSAGSDAFRLMADPFTTEDPTSQFDLTWPTGGAVGPDNPADSHHPEYTTKAEGSRNKDMLSPWYSYKIYYRTFETEDVAAWQRSTGKTDNRGNSDSSFVFQTYLKDSTSALYYTNWPKYVMTNSPTEDPSAPKSGGRFTAYDSLGVVSNGVSSQKIRLYDLDFDQNYVVVIVGVDKAGNEGPAGMWSWATNDTIKFAVTQGVIRASSAINAAVGTLVSGATTNTVGMSQITGPGAPAKAMALYWKAAGQKDPTSGNITNVTKYYDLIYRDASSFNELGNEQWNLAGAEGGNSGTSKTNWNYQADAGLGTPNRLRFFRASYHDRWQDKKPGTQEDQYPLASEEVYSMNNIVLSEGFNYVSLQGVPWTNTFEGVFGTDTNMWPGGETASDTNATQVAFFEPGTTQTTNEWFYFGKDGRWYDSQSHDVTTNQQSEGFFARPFSLTLPESNAWWEAHGDYEGAKASASKSVKALMWHPIMQVPTNSPTASGYSQVIKRGVGKYNLLSLNLPVAVHPSKLGLEDAGLTKGEPWEADQLYVVDTATKEVRGGSTMYCGSDGTWRFVNGGLVPDGFIRPNDMLVLISAATGDDWTWTYKPEDFYAIPNRHMGRKLQQE